MHIEEVVKREAEIRDKASSFSKELERLRVALFGFSEEFPVEGKVVNETRENPGYINTIVEIQGVTLSIMEEIASKLSVLRKELTDEGVDYLSSVEDRKSIELMMGMKDGRIS